MKFAPHKAMDMRREPWLSASIAATGAWIRLAVRAHELESEIINTPRGDTRGWMAQANLSPDEIDVAVSAGLAEWRDGGLWVAGFDHHGKRKAEILRNNGEFGKKGGRPKASRVSKKKPSSEESPNPLFSSLPISSYPISSDHEEGPRGEPAGTCLSEFSEPRSVHPKPTAQAPRNTGSDGTEAKPPSLHTRLLSHFVAEHLRVLKKPYVAANEGADASQLGRLLNKLPAEEVPQIEGWITRYFEADDDFIRQQAYSLAFFAKRCLEWRFEPKPKHRDASRKGMAPPSPAGSMTPGRHTI